MKFMCSSAAARNLALVRSGILVPMACLSLGANGVFEISVEPFVVIELGAVAGQVKHHAGASQMKSHDLLAPLVQRLQLLISSVFFVHDTLTSKSTKVQTSCGRLNGSSPRHLNTEQAVPRR